jgi:hypothetical protein
MLGGGEGSLSAPCLLGVDPKNLDTDPANNFTMPWNSRWTVKGALSLPFDVGFEVRALPWADEDRNGDSGELRWLNVSEITGTATPTKGARITFSSNQPVVGIRGAEGLFTVSFSYSYGQDATKPGTGTGYATITANGATPGETCTLFLDAKKSAADAHLPLTRTIKITVAADPEPDIE